MGIGANRSVKERIINIAKEEGEISTEQVFGILKGSNQEKSRLSISRLIKGMPEFDFLRKTNTAVQNRNTSIWKYTDK